MIRKFVMAILHGKQELLCHKTFICYRVENNTGKGEIADFGLDENESITKCYSKYEICL